MKPIIKGKHECFSNESLLPSTVSFADENIDSSQDKNCCHIKTTIIRS